jgi:hypothetical protein
MLRRESWPAGRKTLGRGNWLEDVEHAVVAARDWGWCGSGGMAADVSVVAAARVFSIRANFLIDLWLSRNAPRAARAKRFRANTVRHAHETGAEPWQMFGRINYEIWIRTGLEPAAPTGPRIPTVDGWLARCPLGHVGQYARVIGLRSSMLREAALWA